MPPDSNIPFTSNDDGTFDLCDESLCGVGGKLYATFDSFAIDPTQTPPTRAHEYGWEKLYAERVAMAYERRFGMQVRIARFENCYGAEGTWRGGREKAPAAICRKVAAEVDDDSTIEVWGDGSAIRSYTHINDMVGCPQYVSVDELAATVAEVAG